MKKIKCLKKSVISTAMAFIMGSTTVINPLQVLAKPVNAVNSIEKESNVGTKEDLLDINTFTVSDVALTDTYCVNATQKEIDYLKKFDVDKLLAGFRETAGLDTKDKTRYGGWEDSLIGGHCVGHYMSALAQAYDSINVSDSDKQALFSIIKPLIQGLRECQDQSGIYGNSKTGYLFGAKLLDKNNVEKQFDNVEINRTNLATESWVPWYTMHKILAGLLDIAKIESDNTEMKEVSKIALEIAQKLGEWVYNRASKWTDATHTTVLNIEYGGMNDVLYDLYAYAKEDGYANAEHFKTAAHLFDENTLFERICNSEENSDVLSGLHANTTIPKFLGALKGYVICKGQDGTENYKKYAESFWNRVVKHHTYITGDNSEWEHFRRVDALNENRTNCNCETCNAYNMLKMSRLLFQLTGEKKYADFYENTFQNTILSSQNPETGMTTYFQPMATGYFKVYSTDFTKFWCCTGSGMESFTKLNDSLYFYKDNNVIVNQFISSQLHWKEQNVMIEQESGIPNGNETIFTVSKLDNQKEASTVTFYLRIPDWASDQVSVKINEEEYSLTEDKITRNGYVVIPNITAGDKISYTIPMEVVPYTLQDAEGSVFAFKYGPVVLSAELEQVDWEANSTITGVDVTIPNSKKVDSETIAITAQVSSVEEFMENINTYIVRDTQASDLTFDLQGTNTNLKFTTHYKQYKNRYGIYWYFVQDEESISKAVISAKETARLNENRIGESIRPGYTQDETTLTDHGSVANSSPNYRYAKENGSFSYDVMVDKSKDNYLLVSFYKEDYDQDKTIQMIAGENTVIFSGTVKELVETYQAKIEEEIISAEILLSKQILAENAYDKDGKDYIKLTFSGVSVSSSESGDSSNSEDGKVVYFVDCGDYDVTTLSEGDQFGTRNSVTDQVFGKDAKTEYTWGIVDNTEPSEKHGNAEKGVFTNHTWANEQISGDGVAKEVSNRYTKDQFEDSIDRHLEYDFELSAGTYIIETAFVNPWNVSSPVQIKANTTILCESLEIPQNECKSTKGTIVLEEDGMVKLRAEAKDALCINMAYIKIEKKAENTEIDTSIPTKESARICSTLSIRGAYSEQADFEQLKVMDMSDHDITESSTVWDREKKEIVVTLPENYTEDVKIQFTLKDKNGYLLLDTYAIDDTKPKDFSMKTSRILTYPMKVYAEDHKTYEDYNLTLYKEYKKDDNITYFVDCGDYNVTTVSDGDAFGINNSVTEQIYGKDPVTNKMWGLKDKNGTNNLQNGVGSAVFTAYTWANEANAVDGLSKMSSFRYTKNQFEILDKGDVNGIRYLDYAFELDAGTYDIEIGMSDPWNCSSYPSIYLNYNDETKEYMQCLFEKTKVNTIIKDTFEVKAKQEISLNFRGTGEQTKAINVSYIIIKPSGTVDNPEEQKYETVYFVDCGDFDTATISEGDVFGTRNSVTDQVFGKDAKTGYSWGIVDNTEASEKHGDAEKGVFTNHTWANEQIGGDGVAKEVSNRYTKDQFEDNIDRHLEYDFELSAGTYIIETAFVNPWNVSSPVQIKANDKILCESLEIPQNDCKVTSNTITLEKDEIIKLRAEAKDALCINMAYIIIKGEKPSSDDNNNNQNKPDNKPDDSENNQKPSDQPGNNGNNSNNSGNGTSSGNGSINNTNSNTNTGNNNASNNTGTNNEAENNNTSTQNPTVTTEEKPDGTIVTTTIEKQENNIVKTTIVEEKPDGTKIESVKEEKTDGSSVETKNVTSLDNSVVLQAVTKTDTAGNASTDVIILTGIAKTGKITVAEDLLKSIIENNKVESLVVEISKQTITSTVQGKANTIVNISIPKIDGAYVDKVMLTRDAIETAKGIKKGLKVKIENKSDDNYIVTIPAKQLAKVKASLENLNISVKVDSASNLVDEKKALVNVVTTSKGNQKKTGVISVAENMAENVGFKISAPIEKTDIAGNSIVYIYKYNTRTGKLEEVANSKTKVTADGMITMEAISNTDYIISAKKLSGKNVETIKEMIKVSLTKNSVKAGKNVKVKVSLPDTVSTSKKFATEKANITYKSGNKKIASISSKGVIKTKKKGKAVITTIIKLESGQKITKENKITIK